MTVCAAASTSARRFASHPPRPSPAWSSAIPGGPGQPPRAAALAALALLAGCFEAWVPSGPFGCSRDGTCPRGLECDRPFGGPAVCCDQVRGQCPTLPAPDGTCANGSAGALFFVDRDGDGFASVNEPLRRCARPVGAVLADAGPDCDDSRAEVNADTPEACNGRDDNCNGVIDEGQTPRQFFGLDEDGDGYPLHDAGIEACMAPPGTAPLTAPHDCQPLDPAKHPGAGELCNDFDDDCDGSKVAASYLDTQLASEPVRLPCLAERDGVCAGGVLTCDQGRRAVCTSVVAPSWERCDGVDTDCDGSADDAPGCGGPPRLTGQADFSYGGGLFTADATLTTACQKGRVTLPGNVQGARLSGARPPMGDSFLLFWVEAPPGKEWDLSKRDARLRLKWTATGTGADATKGLWGNLGPDGVLPVVHLCTEDASTLVRYRWRDPATSWKRSDTSFDSTFFLDARGDAPDFIIGIGSGADTRKVRRLEVLLRFFGSTYDFTMQPEAGFLP